MTKNPAAPVEDGRPLVSQALTARGTWLFAAILAVAGLGLFIALEARRSAPSSPAIALAPGATTGPALQAPPPLYLPPEYQLPPMPGMMPENEGRDLDVPKVRPGTPSVSIARDNRRLQITARQSPDQASMPSDGSSQGARPSFENAYYNSPTNFPGSAASSPAASDADRAKARRLANPSTTVPQGVVIHAVLETALDSNHPGFARAIVSRDVYGFDGTKVLIPRGSKLFGQYEAEVASGQNRALIQWRRLTRPDGGIIDVDSPSADPLGRAGVRGKVNSHFFERFGGAILQSTLDIGVQLATRKAAGNTVILGLPNSVQNTGVQRPESIQPTLSVRQGTSVSVFVARDLDFSDIEQ